MAILIGDIVRVTCNFLLLGAEPYVNTFNIEWNGVGGLDDDAAMVEIASAFDTAYLQLFPRMSDNLAFVDIQGQNITQDVMLPTKLWPTLTTGQSLGHLLPLTVCGYVFYRTTRPKTRASNFVPGLTEDDNGVNGTPSVAMVAALQAFGDLLVAGLPVLGGTLVYGAFNRPLNRFTLVNAAIVSAFWRTQRRRGRGVEL